MFRDTQLLLLSNQREPTAREENKFWALGCLNKSYTVTALDDMKTWIKELSQGPTPAKRSRQFMAIERERERNSLLQGQVPDRLSNSKQSTLNPYT